MSATTKTPAELAREMLALIEKVTAGAWKLWGMEVHADQDGTSNLETSALVATTHFLNAEGRPRTNDASFIAFARNNAGAICDRLLLLERVAEAAKTLRAFDIDWRTSRAFAAQTELDAAIAALNSPHGDPHAAE